MMDDATPVPENVARPAPAPMVLPPGTKLATDGVMSPEVRTSHSWAEVMKQIDKGGNAGIVDEPQSR